MTLKEFMRWLRKPKRPIAFINEMAKVPEAQYRYYAREFIKGLRKPTPS